MVEINKEEQKNMISPAELPINARGAVYHLDLKTDELADTIITVGDPARVSEVSRFFDKIELKRSHREFITHTGYLDGHRISVVSTGIGMPNIDIVMNELDAVANIDLSTRKINEEKKKLKIIRLGTTGGLISSSAPGDIIISRYAIGFDTLINYYQYQITDSLRGFEQDLTSHLKGDCGPFYVAESCPELAEQFKSIGQLGITATCGGFYGPQGRHLRIPLRYPDFIDQLSEFKSQNYRVTNLEMETAAIYALGQLLGHSCLSISVVLANRATGTFAADIKSYLDLLITESLLIIKEML